MRSYSVPGCRLPLHVGSHCSPGYLRDASGSREEVSSLSPCPFWTKPNNPRGLAFADDGYISSCSYPYPAVLDGIPGRVPSYHRLGPLQGLMASRYPGAYASLLHREGGSCTRTRDEVARTEARAGWS